MQRTAGGRRLAASRTRVGRGPRRRQIGGPQPRSTPVVAISSVLCVFLRYGGAGRRVVAVRRAGVLARLMTAASAPIPSSTRNIGAYPRSRLARAAPIHGLIAVARGAGAE